MKKLLIISIILFSSSCLAYNHSKCRKTLHSSFLFGGVMSTSSFVSSTGDCAMIGMAEHDKKVFIAHNLDQITIDAARGQGEYLSAYASLSGCSKSASEKFGNTLQNNFTKVFGQKLDHSPEQTYGRIEGVISNDPELRKLCRPQT